MKAPTGERWVHEIKHDGFRIVARRIGRDVRLFTKQGSDYTARYPLVVEAIARLRVSSIVLDGEAVSIGSDGLPEFDALWNRTNDAAVLFFAFDVLALEGQDLRPRPLLDRKKQLFKVLSKDRTGLRFVGHLSGDGQVISTTSASWGSKALSRSASICHISPVRRRPGRR